MIDYFMATTPRGRSLTVYANGELRSLSGRNPLIEMVLRELEAAHPDEQKIHDLITTPLLENVARAMRALSPLVSYTPGWIFFDQKPLDEIVVESITAGIIAGKHDWEPIVRFLEKLAANPSENVKTGLYRWLRDGKLTLMPDGRFVGYKGLTEESTSYHAGGAFVDGAWVDGRVPNQVGSLIELHRHTVNDNPRETCGYGLHVATRQFAIDFAGGQLAATVLLSPTDVVVVPDGGMRKFRVHRYEVARIEQAEPTDLTKRPFIEPEDLR